MTKTFFILRNTSGSDGQYLLNGETKTIYPGEKITLNQKPTNHTANVMVSMFCKEVTEPKILNKKPQKPVEQGE